MSLLITAVLALANDPPVDVDPSTGKGPEWGKAAPVGLLVILLLGVATIFLLRSMNRRLRQVPASFDPPQDDVLPGGPAAGVPAAIDPGAAPDSDPPGSSGLVNERFG